MTRKSSAHSKALTLSRKPNSIVNTRRQVSHYSAVRQPSTFVTNPYKPRIPQYITALIDPFNQDSNGIKVPDINQLPSIATVLHGQSSINTDANGLGGFIVTADPNDIQYNFTAKSYNSWTYPATWAEVPTTEAPNMVNFSANCSVFRTVAWGIKISCPQLITGASGIVHVCLVPAAYAEGPDKTLPTSLGGMRVMPGYMNVPVANLIQDSLVIPGRIMDEGAHRYRTSKTPWAIHTTVQDVIETSTGWSHIMVVMEGGTVSAAKALSVELIHHVEGVTRPATSVMAGNHDAAPFLPQLLSAAMNVMRHIPFARILDGSSTTTEPAFWKNVEGAVASVSRIAAMPAARLLLTL